MSREDVLRLATAIAAANGHDDAASWGEKVAQAWGAQAPAPDAPSADAGAPSGDNGGTS